MIDYEGDKSKVYSAAGTGEVFGDVMRRRLNRRSALKSGIAASAVVFGASTIERVAAQSATPEAGSVTGKAPAFAAVPQSEAPDPTVATGYTVRPFLRRGDPLYADTPPLIP